MQAELEQLGGRASVARDYLADYARRAIALDHPLLARVLDAGYYTDSFGDETMVVVREAIPSSTQELRELREAVGNPVLFSSIVLSVRDCLAYLHEVDFRGEMALSPSRSLRIVDGVSDWFFRMLPPAPSDIVCEGSPGFHGIPAYSAPEMMGPDAMAHPTPASDSFWLGVLLFELITGKSFHPNGGLHAVFSSLLSGSYLARVAELLGANVELGAFVMRALSQRPEDRPSLTEWSAEMTKLGGRTLPPLHAQPGEDESQPPSGAERVLAYTSVVPHNTTRRVARLQSRLGCGATGTTFLVDLEPGAPAEPDDLLPGGCPPAHERGQFTDDVERDELDCTVFAPPEIDPELTAMVQIFAHLPECAEEARESAEEFDCDAKRRGRTTLGTLVQRGSVLSFELSMRGMTVHDPAQELTWRGRTQSVQFEVEAPEGTVGRNSIGTVLVSQDGVPIGRMKFKMRVVDCVSEKPQASEPAESLRYKTAFISYASKDRQEVLRRVQMLGSAGIRYFQDVLDLEPGDRWENRLYEQIDQCDVMFLFWSSAARESEWVEREWRYALERKGTDYIRPVIVEGPPTPPPPPELSHLHFGDRVIHFISPRG